MNKDIALLNCGILPDNLTFNKRAEELDLNKLAYNLRYKSTEYWLNKFPQGFENLPASEQILEAIIEKSLSPLEEIDIRNKIPIESSER